MPLKTTCVRGHDLATTRKRDKSGRAYCSVCRSDYGKERTRTVGQAKYRLAAYGLSVDDYAAMFQTQGGVCAICGDPPGKRKLAVDHCHATGRVRGLLCGSCNAALGLLKEEPVRFESALSYIRERRK